MDVDLTCEYCKGDGWFSDDAGRYRCQECWGHGRHRPSLAEWDALRAERDRYREALGPFAAAADQCDETRPAICTLNPEHGCTTFSYRTLDAARAALDRGTP